jgi:hypothetical protein
MNLSMPAEIRHLVKQAAISTAALERESVDDSAWVVRAVSEKLLREWDRLGLGEPVPELVRVLARYGLAPAAGRGTGRGFDVHSGGPAAAAA